MTCWDLWCHHTAKPPAERQKKIIETSASYIKEITGFSPDEIDRKMVNLLKTYQGKPSAPFKFLLY
jgi:hypothetical protein